MSELCAELVRHEGVRRRRIAIPDESESFLACSLQRVLIFSNARLDLIVVSGRVDDGR
jgi:hypothetical protein